MSEAGIGQADMDAALRDAAAEADTADACAEIAAEALDISDERRLTVRAYELDLYQIDWPDHLDREAFVEAVEESENVFELTQEARLQRPAARRLLRRTGLSDELTTGSLDVSHGNGIPEAVMGGED